MHTSNRRWRGTNATAPYVGALAQTLLEQVHAQIGASAIVAAPAAVPGLDNTGTAEPDLASQARALATQAHTDLASGHFRTLDLGRLPADPGRLPGPAWTLAVHAISDAEGTDWAWVSGAGWYATGTHPQMGATTDQVARAGIEHAASVSPLGGRVRVLCDDYEAVEAAANIARAAHQARLRADPQAIAELEIDWIEADSTHEHTAAMDLCEQGLEPLPAQPTPLAAVAPSVQAPPVPSPPEPAPVQVVPAARPTSRPEPPPLSVPPAGVLELRPEQHAAVEEIVRLWERDGVAQLRWPCGYGKTVAYAGAALAVNASVTAVVVTTLELVEQIARTWQMHWGPRLDRVVAVCSDQEILQQGHPLTDHSERELLVVTDPGLLLEACADAAHTLVVVTYQSLEVLLKACANGLDVEVLVADEAHHTAGPQTSEWTRVHEVDALRLYGTATPRFIAEATGGPGHYSMDDTNTFGQVADERTFGQGIEEGRLAEYQVIASVVDQTRILAAIQDREQLGPGRVRWSADFVAAQVSVLDAIARYGLRSLICFAPTLAWAKAFTDSLNEMATLLGEQAPDRELVALHINASSGGPARAQARDLLAAPGEKVVVVTVVGCFGEGVDVAAVDAVGLFSATRSLERLLQQIGRALRKGERPDKVAQLITPMYTTDSADTSTVLEETSYAALAQVLRALRSVDARFDAAVHTHLRTGQGLERWVRPRQLAPDSPQVKVDLPALAEAISTVILPDLNSSWWRNFALCQEWVRAHGTLRGDATFVTITGSPMRWWLQYQRRLYRRGLLTVDQVAALTGLGFVLDSYRGRFWDRLVAEATQWRAHQDDLLPGPGHPFNATLNYARQLRKSNFFTTRQLAWLDEQGMVWDPLHAERSNRIIELGEFLAAQQRLPDPFFTAQEQRLARYVAILREAQRQGSLHPDHTAQCQRWRVPLTTGGSRIPPPSPDRLTQVVGDLGPKARVEEIVDAVGRGATNDELAQATAVTAPSISTRLTRNGRPALTKVREQALASHAAQATCTQDLVGIAGRFQVTPSRVARLAPAHLRQEVAS